MSDLSIVATASAPSLTGALKNRDGTPFDLTGCTVRFQMRLLAEFRYAVDASAEVVGDPTLGAVRYDWAPADLLIPVGGYEARWQYTYTDTGLVGYSDPANTITVEAP